MKNEAKKEDIQRRGTSALTRLLYCPFCGSEAEYFEGENVQYGHGDSSDNAGVKCSNKNCRVSFSIGNYAGYEVTKRKKEAAKKWNRRSVKNFTEPLQDLQR